MLNACFSWNLYVFPSLQEYRKTSDEDAAMVAASRAASTVIDAGSAVALARLVLIPFMKCFASD